MIKLAKGAPMSQTLKIEGSWGSVRGRWPRMGLISYFSIRFLS